MSSSLSNMNLWGEATQLCRRLCFVRSSRLGTVTTNQSPQLSGIYCKAAYHKVHDEHRDVQSFAAGPPRLMTSGIDCNKLLVQETMRKTWQWYLELWDSKSWPQDRYVDRDFATLRACFPVESKNDEVEMNWHRNSISWISWRCRKWLQTLQDIFFTDWTAVNLVQEWYDIHCRHQTAAKEENNASQGLQPSCWPMNYDCASFHLKCWSE